MKILVTGSEGYIGTILVDRLTREGHRVVGLDTGYFRSGNLDPFMELLTPESTIHMDMRDVTPELFEGFDAVVALAELSNDPLGEMVEKLTHEINHEGQSIVIRSAKAAGVRHFVYASSCSVYGVAEGVVSETSPVNPQTAYARSKVLTEKVLLDERAETFAVTALRFATAFGISPRQRFDVVVPNLGGLAFTTGKITMLSDGSPWRPLVHIRDISSTITTVLSHRDLCDGEIFNVGMGENNMQIKTIAETIGEVFPGCQIEFGPSNGDNRSYCVDFTKVSRLPGLEMEWTVRRGVEEMLTTFTRVALDANDFANPLYTRLKMIEVLRATNALDEKLRWNA